MLWAAELYGFDGPSLMGFLAAVTSRVKIGLSILPLYSRSPALLAMTAAGIDALSGGRCVLGIGASGPQVIEGFHGVVFDGPVDVGQPGGPQRVILAWHNPVDTTCRRSAAASYAMAGPAVRPGRSALGPRGRAGHRGQDASH